jgi:uncharacterized protein YydD (DUF2326 family)
MENQVIKEQLSKKERELAEAVYQLKQKEDQLLSKNSELLRAEETLREERQQIQEMRQRVTRIFQSALQQVYIKHSHVSLRLLVPLQSVPSRKHGNTLIGMQGVLPNIQLLLYTLSIS